MNEAASILVLPEGCLSEILSLTSPRDACRAASISKWFNSAADSDAVWEQFLPPDYREVIARAVYPVVFYSKKQLYIRLSDSHILLDRGHLSFQLDKESGKKCYILGAKELSLAWEDEPRYLNWERVPGSRFPQVCILNDVCCLAIQGKIAAEMLSQRSTYAVYLVIRATGDFRGHTVLAKTAADLGGIGVETESVYIQKPGGGTSRIWHVQLQENCGHVFPSRRKDGWMRIECGEFKCHEGDDGEVHMAFEEDMTHGNWKNDLIVEGIEFRPI